MSTVPKPELPAQWVVAGGLGAEREEQPRSGRGNHQFEPQARPPAELIAAMAASQSLFDVISPYPLAEQVWPLPVRTTYDETQKGVESRSSIKVAPRSSVPARWPEPMLCVE